MAESSGVLGVGLAMLFSAGLLSAQDTRGRSLMEPAVVLHPPGFESGPATGSSPDRAPSVDGGLHPSDRDRSADLAAAAERAARDFEAARTAAPRGRRVEALVIGGVVVLVLMGGLLWLLGRSARRDDDAGP